MGMCHTFRHPFATHLAESAYDRPRVLDFLGHHALKPTMIDIMPRIAPLPAFAVRFNSAIGEKLMPIRMRRHDKTTSVREAAAVQEFRLSSLRIPGWGYAGASSHVGGGRRIGLKTLSDRDEE